jgi:hypothetical protein
MKFVFKGVGREFVNVSDVVLKIVNIYEHPVLFIPIIPVVSLRPSCICHYALLEFVNPISRQNFIVQSLTRDSHSFLQPRLDVSLGTPF